MQKIFYPTRLQGIAAAPASKSEAHRRMICAGLGTAPVTFDGYMTSADMAATINCLTALGANVDAGADTITVCGGERPARRPVMDCGESGSTLRFFVPIAMAVARGGVFRMHGRLGARPMDVYRDLFVPRGTGWHMGIGADGVAELTVSGGLEAGEYELPGNVSSQFVSGMLFALPLLAGDSVLTVRPPVESGGYIRMTVKELTDSGIRLIPQGDYSWRISGGQRYQAVSGRLHGDYSQAAVLLCAGALGHDVTVTGLEKDTTQGDRAVLTNLQKLGAVVEEKDGTIRVTAPDGLHGAALDVRDCPDIAPILALCCQLAEGESTMTGCGRLRLKECDRLSATVDMLNDLGGDVTAQGDTMTIRGKASLRGGVTVQDYNDHRMVMLASVAALHCDGPVTVPGVEALNKSWPDYLAVYATLGGRAE